MAKILLIDDDETMHLIARAYLSKAGHEVETAFDGPDGIAKARTFKPELLLLDINMPRMSGFDVAKQLKAAPETKDIPIFMLTSLKQESNIQRGYGLGIDEYITKPANMEHLKLRIEKFLQKRK
ncbi:MAG: response regulator [Elusimicrobia bacterium]|nr:response regulator [Elusimicrobiota bacterium]